MVFNFFKRFRCIVIILLIIFLTGMAKVPPLVGGPAPLFELENVDGQIIKLSDLKGRFIILNFWATWCDPCTKEIPELEKSYSFLKNDGVEILAINFAETRGKIKKFSQDFQMSFPILLDRFAAVAEKYQVKLLPVTYFVSPDGIIRDKIFGGGITQKILENKINQMKQKGF